MIKHGRTYRTLKKQAPAVICSKLLLIRIDASLPVMGIQDMFLVAAGSCRGVDSLKTRLNLFALCFDLQGVKLSLYTLLDPGVSFNQSASACRVLPK